MTATPKTAVELAKLMASPMIEDRYEARWAVEYMARGLARLEAAGLKIVPGEATMDMIEAARLAPLAGQGANAYMGRQIDAAIAAGAIREKEA